MSTTLHPVYESLVREWEAELEETERRVFSALKAAMPNSVTRRELIFAVFGEKVPELMDLNNNPMDRKIRKTIEHMREKLIPVLSSSAGAGYKLEVSEIAVNLMIGEWERRRENFEDKVRRGRQLVNRIRALDERAVLEGTEASQPTQYSLFG